jgi:hypothetical protein
MNRNLICTLALCVAGALLAPAAFADEPMGFVSFDVTGLNVAEFDVFNETGVNSSPFPDPSFPVSTSVSLSNLNLDIKYASGPDLVFGPVSGYFSLDIDGISLDGTPLSTLSDQFSDGLAGAVSATLTGTFSTTSLTLNDSSTVSINPNFSATISDPSGLQDGDLAVIYGTSASSTGPVVPEPGTFLLFGSGLLGLANLRRRSLFAAARNFVSARVLSASAVVVLIVLLFGFSAAANASGPLDYIRLNAAAVPGSGAAGSTIAKVTGSGFPSGAITPASVVLSFAATCGGTPVATTVAMLYIPVIGTQGNLEFTVPGTLPTGLYYISVTGVSVSSIPFQSSNCSAMNVTHTSTTLAACLPSSSLAVLTGTNVNAYVPKGSWSYGTTGVSVVPIEGTGIPAAIPTAGVVNSCSSNSATGETVCVDNGTNIYELTGSTINSIFSSGANSYAGFSGGSCQNCGVAIDALTNTAIITEGFSPSPSGSALQQLNLTTNALAPPFALNNEVTENPSIDPNRNLILSPNEGDVYDLIKINSNGTLTEYANNIGYVAAGYGEFDSAAEDCTTGIALATDEFTSNLYITDLTQATFFTSPNTWSAPGQFTTLNTYGLAAGTSGISVAAGTTHLGLTSGEFGGNTFVVFQLPSTSGTGTPAFVDYAGAVMPITPDFNTFSAGYDPHTLTAYTSPNNGKAYGLMSDWNGGVHWVGVIDLQALLSAPRVPLGSNTVDPSYDLVAHGIVRYVPVP